MDGHVIKLVQPNIDMFLIHIYIILCACEATPDFEDHLFANRETTNNTP